MVVPIPRKGAAGRGRRAGGGPVSGADVRGSEDRRYDAVFRMSMDGILLADDEAVYIDANPAVCTLLGCPREQIIGRTVWDFTPGPNRTEGLGLWKDFIRAGSQSGEYRLLRPDGSSVETEYHAQAHILPGVHLSVLRDVTERRRADELLRGLLKETHHRVKNNLALVVSLMRISAGRSAEAETKAVLKEMATRVQSVILLNETLYRTENYTSVALSDYLGKVATQSFQTLNARPRDLRLVTDLQPVEALTAQAIPCGLIVNELLTNSLKHGFPEGKSGTVSIVLREEVDEQVCLEVSDDGVGLPADFEARRARSLGIQLISDLARQLGGRLDVGPGPAAVFRVTFKKASAQPTREIPPVGTNA